MASTAKGVSIHFGLNRVDPDHYQGWDGALQGCVNDARALRCDRERSRIRERPCCSTSEVTADAVNRRDRRARRRASTPTTCSCSPTRATGRQVPDSNGGRTRRG